MTLSAKVLHNRQKHMKECPMSVLIFQLALLLRPTYRNMNINTHLTSHGYTHAETFLIIAHLLIEICPERIENVLCRATQSEYWEHAHKKRKIHPARHGVTNETEQDCSTKSNTLKLALKSKMEICSISLFWMLNMYCTICLSFLAVESSEGHYPVLRELARFVYSVPVNSICSERVFA